MIRFELFGVRIRLHPLGLLMAALALALGIRGEVLATFISLAAHETAHVAAAMAAGVRIPEIQLLPFGGSAHIENPYALRPGQLLFTALAGPAANLLLMIVGAAMGWKGVLTPGAADTLIRASGMLMCFNLIPALPLDGGRALYAVLSERMGRRRALALGIGLGRALAALLLLIAAAGILAAGKWNLTLLLGSVFLLSAAPQERQALEQGGAYAVLNGLRSYERPCRARIYAVDADGNIADTLRVCRPGQPSLFCVYRNGKMRSVLDERTLVEALSAGRDTIGDTDTIREFEK